METTLSLSSGKLTLLDESDFLIFKHIRWFAHYAESNGKFYARGKLKGKQVHLHRLITGAEKGQDVDHINGDTLDNRRENLRICSRAENCWNRRRSKTNTTGQKCVTWRKDRQRFLVKITANGKRHWIGMYKTAEEAQDAYRNAVVDLHGEFARKE